jgi:carbamoyltransferase
MITWGISAGGHDASISVIDHSGEILFAGHSERYSRVKNDPNLASGLIFEALSYGVPAQIAWYEKPWKRLYRYARAGQWNAFFDDPFPKTILRQFGLDKIPLETFDHHKSHAAAGYFTSGFKDASILVVDAIGEMNTLTIWEASGTTLTRRMHVNYPDSIGLFYSAFTQRCGLIPNEEEYILMGMAAYGLPLYKHSIMHEMFTEFDPPFFKLGENLHKGCMKWRPELDTDQNLFEIAASVQSITEQFMTETCKWIRQELPSRNLIVMGGVALNCVVNSKIARLKSEIFYDERSLFDHVYIMPNPGDAGSSLGAAALLHGDQLRWAGPYLGTNIDRPYQIDRIVTALINGEILGVANGRAEFGPRALGNRSLLADPRGQGVKDRVNLIKRRQRFRPFAPVCMAEHVHEYFDMPVEESPYMQFTAACKRPADFPAICHIDGTSRVQTVTREQHPQLYELLSEFNSRTGFPMLLNTSLNVRGQPLVNSWDHAVEFMRNYHVRVF